VLMGSWIGRQGQGAQAWATYWLGPRNKLEFSYRHQKVSKDFIPQGGTLTDAQVNADFLVRPQFSISGVVQYESWLFPVISAQQKSNVVTSIQVTFWPGRLGIIK